MKQTWAFFWSQNISLWWENPKVTWTPETNSWSVHTPWNVIKRKNTVQPDCAIMVQLSIFAVNLLQIVCDFGPLEEKITLQAHDYSNTLSCVYIPQIIWILPSSLSINPKYMTNSQQKLCFKILVTISFTMSTLMFIWKVDYQSDGTKHQTEDVRL